MMDKAINYAKEQLEIHDLQYIGIGHKADSWLPNRYLFTNAPNSSRISLEIRFVTNTRYHFTVRRHEWTEFRWWQGLSTSEPGYYKFIGAVVLGEFSHGSLPDFLAPYVAICKDDDDNKLKKRLETIFEVKQC